MKYFVSLCASFSLAFAGVPCNSASKVERTAEKPAGMPLQLFTEVIKEKPKNNILVSPFSASSCLTMAYAGAAGPTKKAMHDALFHSNAGTDEQIFPAVKEMLASLQKPGADTQLEIANAIYGAPDVRFKSEFVNGNKQYFEADTRSLDFTSGKAVQEINGFVEQKTKGKITNLLSEVSRETVLMLINCIYFKGSWQNKFDKANTRPEDFHLMDGNTKQVQMMHMHRSDYRYFETPEFQAIKLPYADGRLNMFVFLPARSKSLASFESGISQEKWEKWLSSFEKRTGNFGMPRYRIEDKTKLNNALSAMGMGIAFHQQQADFSKVADNEKIFISHVLQKTFMEVNEEGTEAAAATVAHMTRGLEMASAPFEMVCDRPFFVAIEDEPTKTILFMGHVVNPQPAHASQ